MIKEGKRSDNSTTNSKLKIKQSFCKS